MSTGAGAVPYPGLRAFSRDESHLFFGREGSISSMVDKLAATRFLAVLGASGSGKSSLVYTGLLDALELGLHPAGSNWLIAAMRPGGAPLRNLAATLLKTRGENDPDPVDIDVLAAGLRRGPRAVAEWCEASHLAPGQNLLLLVDQFEELFRYSDYAGREEAEAFARLLIETANARDGEGRPLPIAVCLTMRSEYLGACAMIPGLAERINDGLFLTPRMTRDECRSAIEGPAAVSGFTIEPQLVTQLLNDMAELAPWDADAESDQLQRLAQRADQLPLMQHLLNRLWLRAQARTKKGKPLELTHADYRALGGLRGALDSHGAEVMAELGAGANDAAECVFRSLVSGTSLATAVRRPCRFSELAVNAHDRDMAVRIVEAFRAPSCNFLQPAQAVPLTGDVVVDISHESLIRQWQRLSSWFELEAESSVTWRRLLAEQEAYTAGKGDLLTGLTLANRNEWWERERPSAAWAARHGGRYDEVERYVHASVEAEEARAAAAAASAAATEIAERAMRDKRLMRNGLALVSVLAVLAIGGAAYGLNQAYVASDAKQVAERRLEEANGARKAAGLALGAANIQRELAGRQASDAEKAKKQALAAEKRAQAAQILADQRRAEAERAAAQERATSDAQRKLFEDIGQIIGSNDISQDLNGDHFRQEVLKILPPEYRSASARISGSPQAPKAVATTSTLFSGIAVALSKFADTSDGAGGTIFSPGEMVQIYFWLSGAQERVGNAKAALDAKLRAFEIGQQEIRRLGGWERVPETTLLATLAAAYDVAWFGDQMGMAVKGRLATEYLVDAADHFSPRDTFVQSDPDLAVRLAEISNLRSVILLDSGASVEAVQDQRARTLKYATIARDSGVDVVHNRYRYHLYQRNSANVSVGEERMKAVRGACETAEQVVQMGWKPQQQRLARQAPLALGSCARMLLDVDDPTGLDVSREAIEMLNFALTWDARDQDLRVERSTLASATARSMYNQGGCTEECYALFDLAREDLLYTLEGKSYLTQKSDEEAPAGTRENLRTENRDDDQPHDRSALAKMGTEVSELVTALLEPDTFSEPEQRAMMIGKFIEAMGKSVADFPDAKSVRLGWARLNLVRAELPDIEVAEREKAYAAAAGALRIYAGTQNSNDSYLGWWLCSIQQSRMNMHRDDRFALRSRLSLATEYADDCLRFAQLNPWHVYARYNAIYGLEGLVPPFYEALDPKLMPYLEYASSRGSPSATEYLQVYAEEHHVNQAKRDLLRDRLDLAASYRFDYALVGESDADRPNWLTLFQPPPGQPLFATELAEYHSRFGEQVEPNALAFIERVEVLSRELGASFPRLASTLASEARYHPQKRDDESEYAMALQLLDFKTGRTPVDARGVAFDGYDPITLGSAPEKGLPRFALFARDAIVLFGSKASMENFGSWQMPVFNGYDPVALADGQRVAGNPLIAFQSGDMVYLFASEANRATWLNGPESLSTRAVEQWLQIFPDFAGDLYMPSDETGDDD